MGEAVPLRSSPVDVEVGLNELKHLPAMAYTKKYGECYTIYWLTATLVAIVIITIVAGANRSTAEADNAKILDHSRVALLFTLTTCTTSSRSIGSIILGTPPGGIINLGFSFNNLFQEVLGYGVEESSGGGLTGCTFRCLGVSLQCALFTEVVVASKSIHEGKKRKG